MSKAFFPRLAAQNIVKNGRFYFPYILTVIFTAAAFYICLAMSLTDKLPNMTRYVYLSVYMGIGCFVVGLFILIFLLYTNSFLMKRRLKELGLYNVLGMGKGNITAVLVYETLYVWLIGVALGVGVGIVFNKLVGMLAYRLMRIDVGFGFNVSIKGAWVTAAFFGAVLLITLLKNIRRLRRYNPVELLHGGNTGEQEPKTRGLLAVLGVLTLGAGYYLAVTAKDPMTAFATYFLAVFLVIIGTYCLFCAVSIAVLKALRKNRRFYYKTPNFIGISGLLHRMNCNAVGLANICILSTMVMVMVSGTVSLYAGTDSILDLRVPSALNITMQLSNPAGDFDREQILGDLCALAGQKGVEIENTYSICTVATRMAKDGDNYFEESHSGGQGRYINFVTADDVYDALGIHPELKPGEAMLFGSDTYGSATFNFGGDEGVNALSFVLKPCGIKPDKTYLMSAPYREAGNTDVFILPDQETADKVAALADAMYTSYLGKSCSIYIDTPADEQTINDFIAAVYNADSGASYSTDGSTSVSFISARTRSSDMQDFYATNGGFLFLGVFLGLVFVIAMVLIMYYKQISEGYEDRQRFAIMQQVGLPKRDIRRSINMQVLIVFFAPLIVAGIHVAFDFSMMRQLLMLFSMFDFKVTMICTLCVFGGFTLFYAAVYALTAKTYYKIVSE